MERRDRRKCYLTFFFQVWQKKVRHRTLKFMEFQVKIKCTLQMPLPLFLMIGKQEVVIIFDGSKVGDHQQRGTSDRNCDRDPTDIIMISNCHGSVANHTLEDSSQKAIFHNAAHFSALRSGTYSIGVGCWLLDCYPEDFPIELRPPMSPIPHLNVSYSTC